MTLDLKPPRAVERSSLIERVLADLHGELSAVEEGAVAGYIPELGKADPAWFGIAMTTTDGQTYGAGDASQTFTIQSVSKPFMYGYALSEYGTSTVLAKVGVEPTGEAFNSIVLDAGNNRPFNPMVNAGAIAVTGLMKGRDAMARRAGLLKLFGRFAARRLEIDEAVYRSERATGHRNRAIAYMMLNSGMIDRDADDILDLYFRQCSLLVTARDLATMAATLANEGVNPVTGERVLQPGEVRDVLTVMSTCGMYDYAGQWAFEVGMPAKSGVSGAIIAVIPGQVGIGVFSPRLDAFGNSVRGVRVCQRLSREFGLHSHLARPGPSSVIRREYRADAVRSKRLRTPRELAVLERSGRGVVVLELQGVLEFGSSERLVRRVEALAAEARGIVIDLKRVHAADPAAIRLMNLMYQDAADRGIGVLVTHIDPHGPLVGLRPPPDLAERGVEAVHDTDRALERCEDAILSVEPDRRDRSKLSLAKLDIFKGLSREECRLLEQIVRPLHFEQGATILREGDPAQLFFVVARGSVTVSLAGAAGQPRRIACIGPGMIFGEMALVDGGVRSADVTADERVVCYGFSVDSLREIAASRPNVMITILGNLTRSFSGRLRQANREIRALE